jgi:hypothetical protein
MTGATGDSGRKIPAAGDFVCARFRYSQPVGELYGAVKPIASIS